MRHLSTPSILAFALALLGSVSSASESQLDSNIDSVALFRDGALVTRVGTANLQPGSNTIRLSELPTSADATSLRARILTDEASAHLKNATLSLPPASERSAAVAEIETRLRDQQVVIRTIEQAIRDAQAEAAFATNIGDSFAQRFGEFSEGSRLTIDQAQTTWAYIAETKRATQETILEAERQLEVARKEAEAIQKELVEASERHALLRASAEIEIESAEVQTVELSVSYLSPRAQWQPRYELRAWPERGVVELEYNAQVRQSTGEDWEHALLSLHTNQANRSGDAPRLSPLRLERASDYARKSYMETSAARARDEMALSAPPPSPSQVTSSAVSFQATINGRVSIPHSQQPASILVTSGELKTSFWSEAVPAEQPDAYLRGRAINELELPILPGDGLAFVDGALSSRITLDKTLPGEELEVSFGIDPMVLVKRVEGAQEDADSGFIDKTRTLRREYLNRVTNHHAVEHKVVIVDRFPISQNAKIEIRRVAPSSNEIVVNEDNKENGLFQWEALLKSKQTRPFRIAYEITYPRDWNLYPDL